MPRKVRLKWRKHPAIVINRVAFKDTKLVYVALANKRIRYRKGQSRIAYIGSTKKGARRIASSAVWKGADLLFEHGIKRLDFHVVVCGKRPGVATWRKLERALLIRFSEIFGSIPKANILGEKTRWKDERDYFSQDRLDQLIRDIGNKSLKGMAYI